MFSDETPSFRIKDIEGQGLRDLARYIRKADTMITEHIDLSDGAWAEVHPRLTHGASIALQRVLPADVEEVKDGLNSLIRMKDGAAVPQEVRWAINEVMVLASVKSWSYGSVDKGTLADIPEEDNVLLLRRLNELYSSRPLVPQDGRP